MGTKRVQTLTIRIKDNRELTILEEKNRVRLAELSNKYSNLVRKIKELLNPTTNQN